MTDSFAVLTTLFVILAIVGFIFLVRRDVGRWKLRRRFGELTNLALVKMGWRSEEFKGQFRDWPLRLKVWQIGRPYYKRTQVVLILKNPTIRAFSLAEDGLFRKSESFGAQVFRCSDAIFDKRLTFKTHSEQFAQILLSHEALRHKLLRLKSVEIELMDEQLKYSCLGDLTEFDTDYAISILDVLCDIARIIENFKVTNTAVVNEPEVQGIRS